MPATRTAAATTPRPQNPSAKRKRPGSRSARPKPGTFGPRRAFLARKRIRPKRRPAMARAARSLAIVTGASTGIGLELARLCVENGFDIVAAADDPKLDQAAQELRKDGASVTT